MCAAVHFFGALGIGPHLIPSVHRSQYIVYVENMNSERIPVHRHGFGSSISFDENFTNSNLKCHTDKNVACVKKIIVS